MFFNALKFVALAALLVMLSACSSDARYHEIQSARLNECNYLADKEYHECVKRQEDGYEEFKKQQVEND